MTKELDMDKIDDAALAILALTLGRDNRAWKGIAMEIIERLRDKGWIEDPRNKSASLAFTAEGRARAERLILEMFSK